MSPREGWGFFIDPASKAAQSQIRDGAKWFLDFLRNVVVVAFLFVLSDKADSWTIAAIAWLGGAALWTYVNSYTNAIGFHFPPSTNPLAKLLILAVALVVVSVFTLAMVSGLQYAILEIARVQRM